MARGPRSDALRNRALILETARTGFASDGPALSLDEIARRAGVGPGTVHRHFPTKASLLEAVIIDRLAAMTGRITRALRTDDPISAFIETVRNLTAEARENLALSAALGTDLGAAGVHAGTELIVALGELLAHAQAAGGIRLDITASDLHAILAGAITIERTVPPDRAGLGIDVVIDGLRTQSKTQ